MEFTPRARKAFGLADAEARAAASPCVGSHYLVLGLFLLGNGVQFQVLRQLGCTEESLRRGIASIGLVTEMVQEEEGFQFGLSAARALDRAKTEALAISHTYVGTEHILLGLFSEKDGPAVRLFSDLRADVDRGKELVLSAYGRL